MFVIQGIKEKLEQKIGTDRIYINEPMKKHTSFKIGGNADIFIKIKTIEELLWALKISKECNIDVTVIGNGTNLLVNDKGIRGIVLKLELDNIEEIENGFIVGAGVPIITLSMLAEKRGLTGLEFASGIPGTIGGAVKMNAGAYGGQMQDIITETTYIDENLEIKTLQKEEHKFEYRETIFNIKNWIIVSTKMILKNEDRNIIKEKMKSYSEKRKQSQPLNYPNAGSIFKRGEEFFTAELIDKCGLKGYKIGDAIVSEKHAGFIVNRGNAKAEDVIKLIQHIQKEVQKKFNKQIELEIKIIGE